MNTYIYLIQENKNCYNTSIIRSRINDNYLKFEDFFVYEVSLLLTRMECSSNWRHNVFKWEYEDIIFSIGGSEIEKEHKIRSYFWKSC